MEKNELIGGVKWLDRALRTACAVILLQTLYFKFSGAPESVYIFSTLGIEPWGRYFTGVCELVAAIFLLLPFAPWLGALLSAGLMAGALAGHVTKLGIEVQGDGGLLFGLALFVFVASGIVLYLNRSAPLQSLCERMPFLEPKLRQFYE
jgi:putative oxidoreductase